MIPQQFPVQGFIQISDEIRRMLGYNIQCYLRQIQIGSNSAGRTDSQSFTDLIHQKDCHLPGRLMIESQVSGNIDKALIHRIDMNIILGNILEI